jgi:diguanylate cyclase (GGDEF)-like protein/putative nucleotidyltransferase with HDIG domain
MESTLVAKSSKPRQSNKVFPGSSTLEYLTGSDQTLDSDETIATAVKLMDANPALSGILILDGDQLLGVLSRQKLYETLGRPYGVAVFMNRSIRDLFESQIEPVRFFHGDLTIDIAVPEALERPLAQRYEPLPIIRSDGSYFLLDLKILLMAQSALLENVATIVSRQAELARALAAIHDLEAILQLVLEGLEELVPYEQAVVYIADKGGIRKAAEHHSNGKRIRAYVPDSSLPTGAWAAFPLERGPETMGFLCVMRTDRDETGEWKHIAESFAASAAIAIGNARIYGDLERLATLDPLTGLLNRRAFTAESGRALERCLRESTPACTIMMDMDHFKLINDTKGHAAGDEVLKEAAQRAQRELRAGDIAGRYGGEEFAFFLPGTRLDEAGKAAERIRAAIYGSPLQSLGINMSASFGVAAIDPSICQPPGNKSPGCFEELLEAADAAMYTAKKNGRNRVHLSIANACTPSHLLPEPADPAISGPLPTIFNDDQPSPSTSVKEVALALASGKSLSRVAYQAIDTLISSNPDLAGLAILRDREDRLDIVARKGFRDASVLAEGLSLGQGCAGRAILERRTIAFSLPQTGSAEPSLLSFMADNGFQSYQVSPIVVEDKGVGAIEVFSRANYTVPDDLLDTITAILAAAVSSNRLLIESSESNKALAHSYDATLKAWVRMLELRDQETEGHSRRVTSMTIELAKAMGLNPDGFDDLRRGALLHDIGKMGIPDSILLKPGKLDESEMMLMKKHPELAYRMLAKVGFLGKASEIPYCHHEKWDGSGYPRGLKGTEIPLGARIFAIVDVWDALCSDRPYRKAMPANEAAGIIAAGSGIHFDPLVAKTFLNLKKKEIGQTIHARPANASPALPASRREGRKPMPASSDR